jgi:homoserine kinase
MDLVERASELGALGATISGAGPSVMLWCHWQETGTVVEAAKAATEGWAAVQRVPFSPTGADVPEL